MDAAHGCGLRYLGGRPRLARVAVIADHLKLQPSWGIEYDELLAEALLDAIVLGLVAIEVLDPKIQRVRRHAIDHALHLAGAAPPLPTDLPIRKCGADRPRRSRLIGVVQVVDWVGSIEE